jgi:hypothetical protein
MDKLLTIDNQSDIFYITSFDNAFTSLYCRHIINNYSVSKEVVLNSTKYIPYMKNENNAHCVSIDEKPMIDFFEDTKYIKSMKNTVAKFYIEHLKRAEGFFYSKKQIQYLNVDKNIVSPPITDRYGYGNNIIDINIKHDFELYSPADICNLPFSYDIIEKDISVKNDDNIFIKRTDVYFGTVKGIIFLNTIEGGHAIIADRYIVPIVIGKMILFPNSILFNYRLNVNNAKAHIITFTVFRDFYVGY